MKNFFLFLLGLIIGAAAVYFYCCKDDSESMIDFIEPKGLITPAQATTLDRAFNSRHQLISDSIVGRPDNRSSWYSLSDVRDYLYYAENQAKDLGYTMNGIRIYLGAHNDTANENGYTTMFIVPTGNLVKSEANMNLFNFAIGDSNPDIPGGDGLNDGGMGNPPGSNYSQ